MSLLDGEHFECRRNLTGVRRHPAVTEDAAASPEQSWMGGRISDVESGSLQQLLCEWKKITLNIQGKVCWKERTGSNAADSVGRDQASVGLPVFTHRCGCSPIPFKQLAC